MKGAVPESLREVIEQAVKDAGVELYDLEYSHNYLQVFIEAESGTTVDVCRRVSETIAARLDESNLILGRYTLEVSSPGLERRLRNADDFRRFVGCKAHVVTAAKVWDGEICDVGDDFVIMAVASKTKPMTNDKEKPSSVEVRIPMTAIKRANLKIADDELFARKDSHR